MPAGTLDPEGKRSRQRAKRVGVAGSVVSGDSALAKQMESSSVSSVASTVDSGSLS